VGSGREATGELSQRRVFKGKKGRELRVKRRDKLPIGFAGYGEERGQISREDILEIVRLLTYGKDGGKKKRNLRCV